MFQVIDMHCDTIPALQWKENRSILRMRIFRSIWISWKGRQPLPVLFFVYVPEGTERRNAV